MTKDFLESGYSSDSYLDASGQTDYSVVLRELMAQNAPAQAVQYYLNKRTDKVKGDPSLAQYANDGVYQNASKYIANWRKSYDSFYGDGGYATAAKERRRRLDSDLAALDDAYGVSRKKVHLTADRAAQEAYIAYMLDRKRMPQELAGVGMAGGAVEWKGKQRTEAYRLAQAEASRARADAIGELDRALVAAQQKVNAQYNADSAKLDEQATSAYASYISTGRGG